MRLKYRSELPNGMTLSSMRGLHLWRKKRHQKVVSWPIWKCAALFGHFWSNDDDVVGEDPTIIIIIILKFWTVDRQMSSLKTYKQSFFRRSIEKRALGSDIFKHLCDIWFSTGATLTLNKIRKAVKESSNICIWNLPDSAITNLY